MLAIPTLDGSPTETLAFPSGNRHSASPAPIFFLPGIEAEGEGGEDHDLTPAETEDAAEPHAAAATAAAVELIPELPLAPLRPDGAPAPADASANEALPASSATTPTLPTVAPGPEALLPRAATPAAAEPLGEGPAPLPTTTASQGTSPLPMPAATDAAVPIAGLTSSHLPAPALPPIAPVAAEAGAAADPAPTSAPAIDAMPTPAASAADPVSDAASGSTPNPFEADATSAQPSPAVAANPMVVAADPRHAPAGPVSTPPNDLAAPPQSSAVPVEAALGQMQGENVQVREWRLEPGSERSQEAGANRPSRAAWRSPSAAAGNLPKAGANATGAFVGDERGAADAGPELDLASSGTREALAQILAAIPQAGASPGAKAAAASPLEGLTQQDVMLMLQDMAEGVLGLPRRNEEALRAAVLHLRVAARGVGQLGLNFARDGKDLVVTVDDASQAARQLLLAGRGEIVTQLRQLGYNGLSLEFSRRDGRQQDAPQDDRPAADRVKLPEESDAPAGNRPDARGDEA